MQINRPDVLAEVTDAFERYERALTGNDVAELDQLFWNSPHALRYGANENLYGYEAIQSFRIGRSPANLARTITRRAITTYGDNMATANIEFERSGIPGVGRQSQTWVKMPEGWRVVAGHVSQINLSAGHQCAA